MSFLLQVKSVFLIKNKSKGKKLPVISVLGDNHD